MGITGVFLNLFSHFRYGSSFGKGKKNRCVFGFDNLALRDANNDEKTVGHLVLQHFQGRPVLFGLFQPK